MLLGQVTYKVGQKHRLALPKQFRAELGDRCVIARGYEGCLMLVSMTDWRELIKELTEGSLFDRSVRQSSRLLLGQAAEIQCDDQGRFVVPAHLYDSSIQSPNVVFVGLGRWVEIWDAQTWTEVSQQLEQYGSDIAQRLTHPPFHQTGAQQ